MAVIAEPKARKGFGNLGIAALMGYAMSSHLRALAVLAVISLASFLPGFFQIPPVDRDEARFAQATKQMIETGDYVDIRFQDEARYKKPVGIYWLQAAVVQTAEALGVPQARTRIAARVGASGERQGGEKEQRADQRHGVCVHQSRPATIRTISPFGGCAV
jgi:hypothetical protein